MKEEYEGMELSEMVRFTGVQNKRVYSFCVPPLPLRGTQNETSGNPIGYSFKSCSTLGTNNNDKMMKQQRQKSEHSKAATLDDPDVKVDFKSILKDIQFLGAPHMTWKEKKDLENKKVASLGGKHPKKQRLPLSVARVMMKKQKEREQKELEENLILRRFGINNGCSSRRGAQRRIPEDRVLKSSEGRFRNGVLDVKGMFKPSTSTAVPDEKKFTPYKGMKKKGGNKNKGKKGGRGKRH